MYNLAIINYFKYIAGLILALSIISCSKKGPEKLKVDIVIFNTGTDNYVRALNADDHYLWVGTSSGVNQVDLVTNNLVRTYTIKDGLKNNYVFVIGIDKEGTKWFGTNAGGLTRFDGDTWRTYLPLHGLADYWVYAIAFANNGDMWIGTWYGVSLLQGERFINYNVSDGLINEWCYGVGIDKSGTIWFGTEGGVSRFDGTSWKSWTNKDGLGAPNTLKLETGSNSGLGTRNRHNLNIVDQKGRETYNPDYVFCVLVDKNDNKWFGTWGGGAGKFNGTTWTNYSQKDGLAGNIVYAIVEDRKGNLWFGTSNGLSVFDGKRWKVLRKEDGLLDDHVYSIAIDRYDNVWLGQRGGVVKLPNTSASERKGMRLSPSTPSGIDRSPHQRLGDKESHNNISPIPLY